MTRPKALVLACAFALVAWMPAAHAQLQGRHETRAGLIEFETNGCPTADAPAALTGVWLPPTLIAR